MLSLAKRKAYFNLLFKKKKKMLVTLVMIEKLDSIVTIM